MCGELSCIPQFYLSFVRMSQCLPIPYSFFTSNIKLLSFRYHGFKSLKNPSISVLLDGWAWSLNLTDIWTFWTFGQLDLQSWWIEEWQGLAGWKVRLCWQRVPCQWWRGSGTDWKFPLRLRVLLLWALHVVVMTSPKPNLSLELCCYISCLAAGQAWVEVWTKVTCQSAVPFQSCVVKENTLKFSLSFWTPQNGHLTLVEIFVIQEFYCLNFSTETNTGFSLT